MTSDDALYAVVARLWEEVLEVGEVTPASDFFADGGDSFAALQVAIRLQEMFAGLSDVEDKIMLQVFESPTLEDFVNSLHELVVV